MTVTKTENGILLSNIGCFDPFVSCECGQCFRFLKISDHEYRVFAGSRAVTVKKLGGDWLFTGTDKEGFDGFWRAYFDLDRDYAKIIKGFSRDKHLSEAASSGSGIRIFRQDPWETLVSFIISQNNNIPRIKKIIFALCELLGEPAESGTYSFPTPEAIVKAGVEGLAPIRSGFRAKYIVDAAQKTLSGAIDPEKIRKMPYEEAREELKKIKGVGDKVANCVLLFGYGFLGAFPVDVWVKKVIGKYYGEGFDPSVFGEYAGIAQQYLFYYERNILTAKA
ncbi:MAG: DNA-3-methyladenine glycosylase 2 family protein [Clostridia bacterium]|nr:DNA-3-methyladenine glycosylase 2 family protein [Clostridia bacterium]